MKGKFLLTALVIGGFYTANAQEKAKPEDTEVYSPVPPEVKAGKKCGEAPSDAIVLFNGTNLDQWVMTDDRNTPAKWNVGKGILTVNKQVGNIETKKSFNNYQLHIEWRVPANITGTGQGRGNSGVFLASLGKGDAGYELQVLDAYNNKTYTNGMAGSIYKQSVPLANPAFKPGEWQTYDVIWNAPVFGTDGALVKPAHVTVIFNGVVVQNDTELKGPTQYIGEAAYRQAHGPSPIKLQAHGDKSEPLSFRNIWVREL
ncbi:DUF1080 domain-containing protein [Chitinophaga sp. MM2321]|uniref:3-keto-disaccharide hydrolase n=1 Tax=Chitinophaga sp. MM2321 TaxID=3137178 RepID=UPI0032D58FDF